MSQPPPRPGAPRPGRRPAGARPRAATGAVLVDATLGLGGHTEAVLDRAPAGPGRRHRPRPRTPSSWPASGSRRSATGSPPCTRCTTRSPRCSPSSASPTSTPSSSTSASPRCSSTSPSAASPTPRTRRSTCGWTRPPGPTAADVLNTYSAAELTRVLREYGEEKFARRIAAADRPRARARAVHHARPGSSSCSTPRSRRRPGVPAATRPSAPSRRCGWRSTTSSRCCAARSPPPSTRSASAAAWSWSPTTRSRTGWSSRRSPPSPAATSRRTCRSCPEGSEPALRLVTRGAEKADADEIAENPRAASVRLRAVERVRAPEPRMTPEESSAR